MALGGSAAAAPMVSSSSSGGAGRPISARASVPLRRGCCCCCPFYSRGCDLNLYLSVSSLQTPPRSRHRLPCPAGRVEGAEAGGGAAAAAAPQLGAPGSVRSARRGAGRGRHVAAVPLPAGGARGARPHGPDRPRRRPAAAAGAGAGGAETPLLLPRRACGVARRRLISRSGFLCSNCYLFIFNRNQEKLIFQPTPA